MACLAAGVARGIAAEKPAAPASAKDPVVDDLETHVIAQLQKQLDEKNAESRKHKDEVDEGRINVIRPKLTREGFEKPSGWVIQVVRPFENDYFTSSYTALEMKGWEWADPAHHDTAVVSFDETLFVKNGDTLEALRKEPWLKMMTIPHRMKASREGKSWRVEEAPGPSAPNAEGVHQPAWKEPGSR